MAQIVCISSINHKESIQELGDIIGVFEDSHQFSPTEIEKFDFFQIDGFTAQELSTELRNRRVKIAEMWQDTDDVWKELKEEPKFDQSIKSLNTLEMENLADSKIEKVHKLSILDKIIDRTKELSINQEIVNYIKEAAKL